MRLLAALCLVLAGCGAPLLYEGRRDLAVEPLEVRLVRIRADGLSPAGPIRLTQGEGGVAFLNDTRDEVVSVVIDGHVLGELRCAYTQGFASDEGATFTAIPLGPGASASLCLHDAGTFAFEVRGTGAAREGALEVAPARGASP